MTARDSNRILLILALVLGGYASESLSAAPETDAFGGFLSIETEATGFFRVEKIGERWFFVSPEGHAYVPIGVNHLASYFRREKLAGNEREPDLANLLDHGDKAEAVKRIVSLLHAWGFNYAGYDAPPEFRRLMPFSVGFYPARVSAVIRPGFRLSFGYEDIFDPAFEQDLDKRIAERTRPHRDNPYLVGYYLTDLPLWGDRKNLTRIERARGDSWVSYYRKLPPDSAGRRAYLDFLRERYAGRFDAFKAVYPTENDGFTEAMRIDFSSVDPALSAADDEAFQGVLAEQLYTITVKLFRKHDPNHLVLGERFAGDSALIDPVLMAAARHFPIVAIQKEGAFDKRFYDRVHQLTGRPIVSVDHVTSFPTPEHPKTRGHAVASEEAAAEFYRRYLTDAFGRAYMIGYNRCQLVDRMRLPGTPPTYKQGLIQLNGEPYEKLVSVIRETNLRVLKLLAEVAEDQ